MYVLEGESQISVECPKRGSGGIFNFLHARVIDLFWNKPFKKMCHLNYSFVAKLMKCAK